MKESWFERMIFSLVTRGLDKTAIASYEKAVEKQEALASAPAFQTLDGKATGLLTHVGMMVAGLGLVAPLVAHSDLELGIIITEMAVYLLIAVGCLRCLSTFAGRELTGPDMERRVGRELLVRRELLSLCVRASIIVTIIVFVLLPIQFLYVAPPK
ncbi:MAG TPA: hypothetical protein VHK44_10200 [Xanthobacteraceae bacterium]|jgi:hypothetical protein|nr:hypothetical protein [Xanthobacteraceae bacterium]